MTPRSSGKTGCLGEQRHPPRRLRGLPGLAVVLFIFNLGCSSVLIQRLEPRDAALGPADSVAILNELPPEPYRALARIEVRDRGRGRSAEQLREKLIAAASRLGADAVVLESPSTNRSLFVGPGLVSRYDDLMVSGLAILRQLPPGGPGGAAEPTP